MAGAVNGGVNRTPASFSAVLWLTGLSGAGKSTLAYGLRERLDTAGVAAVVLDGDELRRGPCRDLGFSAADRRENVRRAGEEALRLAATPAVVIVALISPFREGRAQVAAACRARGVAFAEIFVNAPLAECERRDPKRLYRRARAGEVREVSGLDAPYEAPLAPALELRTDREPPEASLARLEAFVRGAGMAAPGG